MFPILTTERLILRPLQEDDFDDMFTLWSDPTVLSFMEGELQTDKIKFKKDHISEIDRGELLTIRKKETDKFIGFIGIHQYMKNCDEIRYSQIWTAILPEYWNIGFCSEATKKILHFAFLGIKTPLIYANQFHINPAAGKVLKTNGFSYYRTLKMDGKPYDQYRYFRESFLRDNATDSAGKENIYEYVLPLRKSAYSYENPVRRIDEITYIKEPTGYLCGQSVIAMLAEVSVDEVIKVMQTDKGTSVSEIGGALAYYGIKHAKTRKRVKDDTILPDICILSLRLPGYGHWSLYYKGVFYDPEFGVLNNLPPNSKLNHYWEIFN